MKTKTKAQFKKVDFGMVCAIISDNIMKQLYEKQQQGYIQAAATIADWSEEFENKHKKTNWEDALEKGMKNLSKYFKSEIICWDDAIIDFAHYKLENYGK